MKPDDSQKQTPKSLKNQPQGLPLSPSSTPQTVLSREEAELEAEKLNKPRRNWKKLAVFVAIIILVAGSGVLLVRDKGLRATVLHQKLVSYNYPTYKTHKYSVKFYRGSRIGAYSPPTAPGKPSLPPSTSLISPTMDNKVPVSMLVTAGPINSQSQEILNTYKNCSVSGLINGFNDYIPALNASADVCAVPSALSSSSVILGYVTAFTSPSQNSFFLVIINEDTTFNAQGQPSGSFFDLSNHQKDMQSIIASIKPL